MRICVCLCMRTHVDVSAGAWGGLLEQESLSNAAWPSRQGHPALRHESCLVLNIPSLTSGNGSFRREHLGALRSSHLQSVVAARVTPGVHAA